MSRWAFLEISAFVTMLGLGDGAGWSGTDATARMWMANSSEMLDASRHVMDGQSKENSVEFKSWHFEPDCRSSALWCNAWVSAFGWQSFRPARQVVYFSDGSESDDTTWIAIDDDERDYASGECGKLLAVVSEFYKFMRFRIKLPSFATEEWIRMRFYCRFVFCLFFVCLRICRAEWGRRTRSGRTFISVCQSQIDVPFVREIRLTGCRHNATD